MPYKQDRIIGGKKWKWVTQFNTRREALAYAKKARRSMGWRLRVIGREVYRA